MSMASPASAANPWLSQTAVIREIVPEISGVATYRLQWADEEIQHSYNFLPGQFNMLYLPGAGEAAISVSRALPDSLEHTVRVVGNVTQTLARLRVGDTIGLRGPYGTSWPVEQCVGHDVVLVAGGIGLAPLGPLVEELIRRRSELGQITLLYGARTPDTLLFASRYRAWRAAGLAIETTVDRAETSWHGNVGVVSLLLDRQAGFQPARTQVMMCGPEVMMRYAARSALARGIPQTQVWISMERNMQCAVGLCGHCQLGPAFVCKDGPVFRLDRIDPYMRVEAL